MIVVDLHQNETRKFINSYNYKVLLLWNTICHEVQVGVHCYGGRLPLIPVMLLDAMG